MQSGALTVTEMLEVLICVEACLWKVLVDLEVELLSSPLRRTTKSPAGTPLKVTRKLPLPNDCGGQWEKDWCCHDSHRRQSNEMVRLIRVWWLLTKSCNYSHQLPTVSMLCIQYCKLLQNDNKWSGSLFEDIVVFKMSGSAVRKYRHVSYILAYFKVEN